MRIKTFSNSSLNSLQNSVNEFAKDNDIVSVQYSSQPSLIIGLQQNNAEVRVMHYVVVTYNEDNSRKKLEE